MADYWQTGMGQTYKARTQQSKFQRDSEKRDKFAGIGSEIGGLLFGAPGNYFGAEIGGMMSGVSRDDISGGDDDWFMDTRRETLQGLDDRGMNEALESIKSGNFFGAVGGMMGGGKFKLPGGLQVPGSGEIGGDTFGDLSSYLGGDSSGGTGGNFLNRMMGGGPPDMPPEFNSGGNVSSDITSKDSVLGRAMYNENKGGQIDEAALKEAGDGWWVRWKTGQLSEEEQAWVEENYGARR